MDPAKALKDHPLLQRFEQVKPIGRGAFGVVFQAFDPRLERKVAVKLLLIGQDQNVIRRFQREAEAQANIQSDHVVRLYDSDFDVHPPGVVLEWVGGGSLLERLQRRDRPAPPAEVRRIARSLLKAVGDVHEAGLVHRDVKPANVFFKDEGEGDAVLGDLGLVGDQEMASTLSRTGVALGTPKYMPPEVMRGQRWTPAGDFFGVGLSLWEYATGVHPNVYFNHSLMMFLEPDLRLPSLRQAGAYENPALQALVDALMDVDADRRPPDVELALQVLGDEEEAAATDAAAIQKWTPPDRDGGVTLEMDLTLRAPEDSKASRVNTRGQAAVASPPRDATQAQGIATKAAGIQSATRAAPMSRAMPAPSLVAASTVPPPVRALAPRVAAAVCAGLVLLGGGVMLATRSSGPSDGPGPPPTTQEGREFPSGWVPESPAIRFVSPTRIELRWDSPVKAYATGGARTLDGVIELPRGPSSRPIRLEMDAPEAGALLRDLRIQLVDREGNSIDAEVPPSLTLRSLAEHAKALLELHRAGGGEEELRRLWEPLRELHIEGALKDYDASLHAELEAATAAL